MLKELNLCFSRKYLMTMRNDDIAYISNVQIQNNSLMNLKTKSMI